MIATHQLKVTRTAHYYTLGTISTTTKHLIIACHGYGQLASRFIRKFESIENEATYVVAPEGLSRFYWKGVTGEVAASWMTKHHRLDEIADYSNYLQTLYDQTLAQLNKEDLSITLFGFSQGCATQMRWIMRNKPMFDQLVLWGGAVPEDLDYLPAQDYFQSKRIYHVYGDQDEFLTPDRLVWHQKLLEQNKLEVETIPFAGTHRVDRTVLKALFEERIFNFSS